MTQSFPQKAFTVDEANGLIATMEAVMEGIAHLRDLVESHDRQLQILDTLWGPEVLISENPDHSEFMRHRAARDGTVERIQARMREESRVDQWHEITDGFAGRQPVTPDHERRMGVEPSDPPEAPPP